MDGATFQPLATSLAASTVGIEAYVRDGQLTVSEATLEMKVAEVNALSDQLMDGVRNVGEPLATRILDIYTLRLAVPTEDLD